MPIISVYSDSPTLWRKAVMCVQNLARSPPDTFQAGCCDNFHDFFANVETLFSS